jgi:hypothetical protein
MPAETHWDVHHKSLIMRLLLTGSWLPTLAAPLPFIRQPINGHAMDGVARQLSAAKTGSRNRLTDLCGSPRIGYWSEKC